MNEEQHIEFTTKTLKKKRKKRYHHKVHTGCVTCRQRRVRCDEGHPTCRRCQYGERQCHYRPRQVKLFELPAESQTQLRIDIATTSRMCVPIPSRYGTQNDVRSLDFFLRRTSPMISMGSPAKELWTVVIPQASWRYPAVKDMLVAISMLDQYLTGFLPVLKVEEEYQSALQRYNKAIKAIWMVEKPAPACLLLVAVIAWMFESITNRPDVAAIHSNAAREIVLMPFAAFASAAAEDQYIITLLKEMVCKGAYIHAQGRRRANRPVDQFRDLEDAKNRLFKLYQRLTAAYPESERSWASIWQDLDDWRADFENYRYSGPESLKEKRAIFMAHNTIGTYISLLSLGMRPGNSLEEQGIVYHILNNIEYVLEHEEMTNLGWIIQVVLQHIADEMHTDEYSHNRAQRMLKRLA